MKVGDYIIKPDGLHEATIWRVTGIYLGALGHQDLIGLIPINRKLGNAGGPDVIEMLTPIELVEPYLAESWGPPSSIETVTQADNTFANAVWAALKGDHNDLRKQAIILEAYRAIIERDSNAK